MIFIIMIIIMIKIYGKNCIYYYIWRYVNYSIKYELYQYCMLSIERNREFPRKHPLPNLGIRRKPFPIEFLTVILQFHLQRVVRFLSYVFFVFLRRMISRLTCSDFICECLHRQRHLDSYINFFTSSQILQIPKINDKRD